MHFCMCVNSGGKLGFLLGEGIRRRAREIGENPG